MKLSDLAERPDFRLGPLSVSPARRRVEGPAGEIHVEPLVFQAFLLLLDARGTVVTRNELFDRCWGGAVAGDDSLNRAIAGVRRIATETGPGLFEIETVPRTGYRLIGEILASEKQGSRISRRTMVGSAAAVAAAAGGVGLWFALRDPSDGRFDALMKRGEEALRLDEPGSVKYFEQAVAIDPKNARARGLLAYAQADAAEWVPREATGHATQIAERTARTALEFDPNQPDALLTMAIVQRGMLDWFSREKEFRRILSLDPDNPRAISNLGRFLHAVGRCRESLAMSERAIAIEPFAPDHQVRKALRLWVLGRTVDADRVSNRAMELWPSHRIVRLARLMIYAFTGRARAALAMVEDEETNPIFLSPPAASVWRLSLVALETPSASTIAAARRTNVAGSIDSPGVAAWAVLVLPALGELDAAFDVANGLFLDRGPIIVRPRPEAKAPYVNTPGWRNTNGIFTPPTKVMRLDPRFGPLCDGLGLTEYWRNCGIGPDPFLFAA